MKETREVMNTIRAFAAEDATVIFGTVCDEAIGDGLRVTVVATGLGRAASKSNRRRSPWCVPAPTTPTERTCRRLACLGIGLQRL